MMSVLIISLSLSWFCVSWWAFCRSVRLCWSSCSCDSAAVRSCWITDAVRGFTFRFKMPFRSRMRPPQALEIHVFHLESCRGHRLSRLSPWASTAAAVPPPVWKKNTYKQSTYETTKRHRGGNANSVCVCVTCGAEHSGSAAKTRLRHSGCLYSPRARS